MDNSRIETLEIRMTHLENYMEQLNGIVLKNNHLLELIKTEQKSLRQQMIDVTDQIPGPESSKPPHY